MSAPKLSSRQLESIRQATGRVNLWHGSIRSGKTIGSILRFVMFVAAMQGMSGEVVIIGRTRDSAWRNVIAPMQDAALFGEVADQVIGNHGAPTVSILGRRVFVMGASDAKAEKVLRGLTVLGVYVDEVTTIPSEFFTQLLGRMSPPGAKLFGTTNPDSPTHWLKRQYLDRKLPGWRVFHFTIDDNPSLSADYVRSIKAEYTGLWYRRFILGEWTQASGAVYDCWEPERHTVAPDEIPSIDRTMCLGVDYGTTNATAGLLIGLSLAEQRLYVLDEWAPKSDAGRSLTDAEQSASLRSWLPRRAREGWRTPDWIAVDPAAASFRLQLYTDGLSNVMSAHNDVLRGIRAVSSLLATGRLRVSTACTNLLDEVPGYVWDPKATEEGEDAPLKVNDHFCDALRYGVYSSASTWQAHIPIVSADTWKEAA